MNLYHSIVLKSSFFKSPLIVIVKIKYILQCKKNFKENKANREFSDWDLRN